MCLFCNWNGFKHFSQQLELLAKKIAVKAFVAGIIKSTVLQGNQLECSVGTTYIAIRDYW